MYSVSGQRTEDAFWTEPTDVVLDALDARSEGLTSEEVDARLAEYGPNRFADRRRATTFGLLAGQFRSPIVVLLAVAALLSFALGERVDALIVLVILVVSGFLGFWQERAANVSVERLLSLVAVEVDAYRDGALTAVPRSEVVPGDVLRLVAGDTVPADCRVLTVNDLHVDEAALTGESFPAEKDPAPAPADAAPGERASAVFAGTHVVSGEVTAVVVATGRDTELGRVSGALRRRPPATEFERGVNRLGAVLLEVTLVLVLAVFAVNVFFDRPVLESFLFALALAVGLTPQLLPAIVSVNLASGARRMARERVVVKRLVAIENVGAMDVLCSDKTGTLTEGEIRVHDSVTADGAASDRPFFYAYLNATFESGFPNPIDDAVTSLGDFDAGGYEKLDELPYDFARKRLSVLVRDPDGAGFLVTKGAVDRVLAACSTVETADGDAVPLRETAATVRERADALGEAGYRVLGVATRRIDADRVTRRDERDMTLVGFLLLEDPPKPGIERTLRELTDRGVELKLVTGDNRHVAAHVAREVGIDANAVLTGDELGELSEEALRRRVDAVSVFAEIEPTQKERVVRALSNAGHVVGHLGDGINDAAALRAADVGLSVDSAVDVARDAADIVLLARDLDVLVDGIESGRRTFLNTLKYVFMTTSANLGNMASLAVASLFLAFLPLLPTQILLLNLLSDVPAMTIPTDRVDPERLRVPQRWNVRGVRNFMGVFGAVSSLFDFVTFAVLLLAVHATVPAFRTGWFLVSAVTEIVVVFVIRTRRPLYRSRPSRTFLAASALTAAVTLAVPYTPLGDLFEFVPLPPLVLVALFGVLVAYAVVTEGVKRLFYRYAGSPTRRSSPRRSP